MKLQSRKMKLRLRHNSIRLRLGRSEVERLRQGMNCHEAIRFPGNQPLEYTLASSAGATISAVLEGATIRIGVPAEELATWCASDQVGMSSEISLPGAGVLSVLIEKDFRCLDVRVTEDQSDTFKNPMDEHPGCE